MVDIPPVIETVLIVLCIAAGIGVLVCHLLGARRR